MPSSTRKAKTRCIPAASYNIEHCDNPVKFVCKFPNESPVYLCPDHVGAHRVSHAEMVHEIKESDLEHMSKPSGQTTLKESEIIKVIAGEIRDVANGFMPDAMSQKGAAMESYTGRTQRLFIEAKALDKAAERLEALEAADSGLAGKMEKVRELLKDAEDNIEGLEHLRGVKEISYRPVSLARQDVQAALSILKALAPTDAGQDREGGK